MRHTREMGQIMPYGGPHEEMCQDMLNSGILWLTWHQRQGDFNDPFYFVEHYDDLRKKILMIADGYACETTVQEILNRVVWIYMHGWDSYCNACKNKMTFSDTDLIKLQNEKTIEELKMAADIVCDVVNIVF